MHPNEFDTDAEHKYVEKDLLLSKYSDNSIDSIFWIAPDASFYYVNKAACKELSYSMDELLSLKVFDVDPAFSENRWKEHWNTIKKRSVGTVETIHVSKEGREFPVEVSYSYLMFEGLEYNFAFCRDITKRKEAEKNLRLTQHSINHSMEPAFWIARDASFMFVNEAVCKNYGYSREELLSMKVFDISPAFPENKWNKLWNKVKREGSCSIESTHYTKDGRVFPVELSLSYLEFEDIQYIFSFIRDITERKNSEEALQKYTKELRHLNEMQQALGNIVNSSPMVVFLWRVEHNWPVEFVSENIKQFGYSAEQFTSGELLYGEIIHPDELEKVQTKSTELIEKKKACFNQEYRILTKSGEVRWVNERTFIQHDENEVVDFIQGIIVDITSSKQSNKFLQLQCELGNVLAFTDDLQDTYEQLLELTVKIKPFDSGCLYVVNTSTGKLNLVAHRGLSPEYAAKVSHYDADSIFTKLVMMGKPVYKNHSEICEMTATKSPCEKLNVTALIPVKYEENVIAELKLMSHSQNEIPKDSQNSLENIAPQIGIFINRVLSEIELKNSNKEMLTIFESLEDFLIIVDMEGCIINYNSAVPTRLGYLAEELLGVNIISIIPHKSYLEAARTFSEIIEGNLSYFNFPLIAKDKSPVPVAIRFTRGKWKDQDVMIGLSHDVTNEKSCQ